MQFHSVHRGRDEIGGVYLPSLLERTYSATLNVMLTIVKEGGLIFPS
jgi:hypothetical protein